MNRCRTHASHCRAVDLYSGLRSTSSLVHLLPTRPAHWITGLAGIALITLTAIAILWPIPGGVALGLPVEEGTWIIAHGGALGIVNHHMRVTEQHYGIDIIRVPDSLGHMLRAQGLSPSLYASWDQVVLAPIDGVIVAVVDGLADMTVGTRDQINPAGNHVIIETPERIRILLVHLRQAQWWSRKSKQLLRGMFWVELATAVTHPNRIYTFTR